MLLFMVVSVMQIIFDIFGYRSGNKEKSVMLFEKNPMFIRWSIYLVGTLVLLFYGREVSPMFIYKGF